MGDAIAAAPEERPEEPELAQTLPYRPLTLDLEAGTTGFGGALSWRFMDHWGARAGADYFGYSHGGIAIADIHYSTKLKLLSEPLTLDFYPWKSHSFHISLGMMFNQNKLTGDSDDTATIIIDGQPFPVETVGTLHMEIEQAPVNPYLSIGGNFFYFDRAHHAALGYELGVVYTGEPTTTLTRTGPPSELLDRLLAAEQQNVQHYAEKFMWWPIVKVTLSYSF